MRSTLDLNDVRLFTAAGHAGSLSAAAKGLYLPVSTVSRSITRLEKHLGLLLMQRGQKGLELTDAGRAYLVSCKQAMRTLRDGEDFLEGHRASPGGLIRVMCPVSFARSAIAPLLGRFIEARPELRLQIEPYVTAFDQEPSTDVDVFFKICSPRESMRRVRHFPSSKRGLYASPAYIDRYGHPKEPACLARHRCLGSVTDPASMQWTLSNGTSSVSMDLQFHVSTPDPEIHRRLVLDGVGIAPLSLWVANEESIANRLVRVLPEWSPSSIPLYALFSGASSMTPKVKLFLDFMGQFLGTDSDPRLLGGRAPDCFETVALTGRSA